MRQKIQSNIRFFVTIKRVTDTNILDRITEESVNKSSQKTKNDQGNHDIELPGQSFSFANVTSRTNNPLHKSVIFDSGCDNPLTYDKSRFIGEITPTSSDMWVDTPDGEMKIQGHGTMRVNSLLNGQKRELFFEGTAYIPDSSVTLVSANKLKKRGFFWDMFTDTLINKETKQHICEIKDHYGLPIIEYNPEFIDMGFANSVQPRDMSKATPWRLHLRLGHCRPEVIDQLKKIDEVTVSKGENAPRTI